MDATSNWGSVHLGTHLWAMLDALGDSRASPHRSSRVLVAAAVVRSAA